MSRNIPNVNASLIREVRMIAQQFFRSKENSTFWESYHGKAPAAAAQVQVQYSPLKCARCVGNRLKNPKDAKDAITIFEGTALCQDHV